MCDSCLSQSTLLFWKDGLIVLAAPKVVFSKALNVFVFVSGNLP